jgi:peptide/nickel transport system permease protein
LSAIAVPRRVVVLSLSRHLGGRGTLVTGVLIVLIVSIAGICAPWIAPWPPEEANPAASLRPPDASHWFGTDKNGMDIFTRLIYAPRIDVSIALLSALIALVVGVSLGLVAGYYRGLASEAIMRSADILQSFPAFVLAMALVAATGQNLASVVYVMAFVNAPVYLRLMRSKVLSLRESQFVEAARCIGNTDGRLLLRHILPNALAPIIIQSCVNISWAILLLGGLAFVGIGIRPPTPEWGSMVSLGAPYMLTGQWWVAFFPGLAIMLTVLGFNFLADGLQDLLDPRQQ